MTFQSLDEVQLAVGMFVPVVIKATETMLVYEQVEAEWKQNTDLVGLDS